MWIYDGRSCYLSSQVSAGNGGGGGLLSAAQSAQGGVYHICNLKVPIS